MKPDYGDYESSVGDRSITKDARLKSLTALGATLNFIGLWIKLFLENYSAGCDAYVNAMTEMFKQIPQTNKKALTPKLKVQKLITYICGGWFKKSAKGLPPLRRTKLTKKAQENQDEIQKNYMKVISGGMIGDSNCIGTSLNG